MKFEDVTDAAKLDSRGAWSAGAAMIDIDSDGDLDIYVCNFDTPNQLFINNGDGTFAEKAKQFGVDFVGAGHTPTFCDYDLDGDGDDDLWLGGPRTIPGQIRRNEGNGKFTLLDFSAAEADKHAEDMGGLWLDVDSDGDLDLYVVSGGVEANPNTEVLQDRIYLNDGKGGFVKASAGQFRQW